DRGGKTDHAEIEADAEIDLVVIEAVHHPGEGGKARADREGYKHDGSEIDAHRARRLLILRDSADSKPKLRAVEQELQTDDHRDAGCEHEHIVEPQIKAAEVNRISRQQGREWFRIGA